MHKIPIIYYHSVAWCQNPQWNRSYLTFELRFFEDLIKYLVCKKYHFIFLDEYIELRKNRGRKYKKLICLNFDDGYLDNYVFVYPILKKYQAKATIFVNPDYVQENKNIRPNLEDVWENKLTLSDLPSLGFATWHELRVMQDSGIIDIQSHTMTHAKYFISDKIRDFHNPRSDYLYPISNLFPQKKPYYITDPEFTKLIPWGMPFFEEKSACIARRITINEDFQNECINVLKETDWQNYLFEECMNKIKALYHFYQAANNLITSVENTREYEVRVRKELKDSKIILEKRLGKPVLHCCWPHGDYNDFCHQTAIDEKYKSTHIVLKINEENCFDDRFDRIASGVVRNNRFLTLQKAKFKINAYRNISPYNWMQSAHFMLK